MAKSKLATPDWILEGYDSPAEYNKAHGIGGKKKTESSSTKLNSTEKKKDKVFKVRRCPKCGSDKVKVIISGQEDLDFEDEDAIPEGKANGDWECLTCKWKGKNVKEEEMSEDEFMKYLDEKGEDVA